ncbi:DUF4430 domain-containing protein [Ethanoligenens harbinense]|uniref:DUF4430 domain-containing protein n=1 Tax=Ethanoligenens harbinense TaxID=253239 RepID=UPI0001C51BC8|nr:DUF4430 domain-containing protein [Ethanoligenens harbinense]
MKKRVMAIWFALLVACTAVFAGCTANTRSRTTVASVPANGVVRKADFQRLQQSGGIAIYNGKSGGVSYSWTFVGPDIRKPAEADLHISYKPVTVSPNGTDTAQTYGQITLEQKGSYPGAASLRITVGKGWADGSYPFYAGKPGALWQAGTAQVVNGAATIRVSENTGPYLLAQVQADAVSSAAPPAVSSVPASSVPASSVPASSVPASSAPVSSAPKMPVSSAPAPQTIRVNISIRCDTAVQNWSSLSANKQDHRVVPANGVILPETSMAVKPGATVYDLLVSVCEKNGIQMEHKGSAAGEYIEGINNLYEFDAGPLSGWDYAVNGTFPGYGVSQYTLKSGDTVLFAYTCDLGHDIGAAN